jgi:glutamyl-tRNA reductase
MISWPPLSVLSVSHHKTDLGLRERFARAPAQIKQLLVETRHQGVVLSTCNRFEVYWWGEQGWPMWFRETASRLGTPLHPAALLSRQGEDAIRHLFRVTAGLDSQVLGETEIQGQVRQAWSLAREVGATLRELDAVFSSALAAGRRIRRATRLERWAGSLGTVAVAAAQAGLGSTLAGSTVVVVGAGQAAASVLAALAGSGARVLVIARALERARALALPRGAEAQPWDSLDRWLHEAAVVFTATAAPQAFLTPHRVAAARNGRRDRMLIVDLGVPRNVAAETAELDRISVLDLDDLRACESATSPELARALLAAEELLEIELGILIERLGGLATGEHLADLHRTGARLAEEEVRALLASLPHLGERERELIRRMADRLVRRVLYPASKTVRVRAAQESAQADTAP